MGTNYYVSNDGDDSNSGVNPSDAWKTLDKVNSFIPAPGDQILFKRGDEWVGTLIVNASGFPNKPITYGAFGTGEKPIIYGSEIITGWEHHSGNIYKATVSKSINQVFVDELRMKNARYPNAGYILINSVINKTTFIANDLPNFNHAGASIHIRTGAWSLETRSLSANTNNNISVHSSTSYEIDKNDGFFLSNKLQYLDSPGEWCYDSKTNTVYLWVQNGTPFNNVIRGSTKDNAIIIRDKNYITIADLDLRHNKDIAILTDECNYLTLERIDIHNPDSRGTFIDNDTNGRYNELTINGANQHGFAAYTSNSKITNCIITNTALFENLGVNGTGGGQGGRAILVGEGTNNLIQYNRIENSGYVGIDWASKNTLIDKNFIKNVCLFKDDGGAIYTWSKDYSESRPTGSKITNNIILNAKGTTEGYNGDRAYGYGIYIDDRTKNVEVSGNTVAYCGNACIYLHNSGLITVENNTLFDARYLLYVHDQHDESVIKNNILFGLKEDFENFENQRLVGERGNAASVFDYNVYVNNYNTKTFRSSSNDFISFSEWQFRSRQDANSIFINQPLEKEETETLLYNDTKQTVSFNLGNLIFKDVHGNIVSGIISLEPFTSTILIGKNAEQINKSPIASDHAYNVVTPTSKDVFIGKISAFDDDENQNIAFSIVEGNDNEFFFIDAVTGEIFTAQDLIAAPKSTIELTIRIQDDGEFPLHTDAIATINLTPGIDVIPPTINSFVIPSEYDSPNVPVSSFTAVDNGRITGFGITETPHPPQEGEWNSSPPNSFFFSEEGEKTLYAWAIDTAGNVSSPEKATILISIPDTIRIVNNVTICEGRQYNSWHQPGIYRQLKTVNTDTVQLTITELNIASPHYVNENITIREGQKYNGWTESGTYERNLENINGCDSIVTTNLTVLQPVYSTENISICESENYNGWDTTGQYTRRLRSSLGADSIITTNLQINPTYYREEEVFITEGENYNGWTESGNYSKTYGSVSGCDSVVVTNLVVHPWTGEPQFTYSEWSVHERYRRNSKEKSLVKDRLESSEKLNEGLAIYPNPAESFIVVDFRIQPEIKTQIALLTNSGQFIDNWQIESERKEICLRNLPSGSYYLLIRNSTEHSVKKIVKQ